jgi:hypothetical protein
MKINELAEVAGVSRSTISRVAKSLFPDFIKNGKATVFTKDQCFDIMANVRKKNMVGSTNLPVQNENVPMQNAEVIAQAVAMAMQSVMVPMMRELISSNRLALPEPVQEDSYSLVGYCAVKGMKINRSELALHGKELKKIASRRGIELKKIPDERWGFVNSYPVKILDEYFAA